MNALIRQAIDNKRIVEFIYKEYPRIVELHIFGKKDGILQVLAYQIGGKSSRGGLPDWRRFNVLEMRNFQLSEASFHGAREYHGTDNSWDEKYLIVAR